MFFEEFLNSKTGLESTSSMKTNLPRLAARLRGRHRRMLRLRLRNSGNMILPLYSTEPWSSHLVLDHMLVSHGTTSKSWMILTYSWHQNSKNFVHSGVLLQQQFIKAWNSFKLDQISKFVSPMFPSLWNFGCLRQNEAKSPYILGYKQRNNNINIKTGKYNRNNFCISGLAEGSSS